jgi:hypothetical protein
MSEEDKRIEREIRLKDAIETIKDSDKELLIRLSK